MTVVIDDGHGAAEVRCTHHLDGTRREWPGAFIPRGADRDRIADDFG